jgi:hypothetical protein
MWSIHSMLLLGSFRNLANVLHELREGPEGQYTRLNQTVQGKKCRPLVKFHGRIL